MTNRMRFSAGDGHELSYLVDGDGPGLLVLPGVWDDAETWAQLGYIDRLAERHRVVVLDGLGYGDSDRSTDPADYSPEATIARVLDVIAHAELRSPVLWGFDTGAEMSVLFARRRPDLVAGVVVGGIFLGDFHRGLRDSNVDARSVVERAADALDHEDWEAYFDILPISVEPHHREEIRARIDAAALAAITRADLSRPRGFLKPPVPTFAYWAENELYSESNSHLAQRLPIDWAVLPGRHLDSLTAVDQVTTAVDGFLRAQIRA